MYSLEMFGRMFADRIRHDAYEAAIRRSVQPGSVVLDIGTGFGFYAMLAAQLGARKVYAVEVNPVVRFGSQLAEVNGLDNRIEFIEAMSTDITLPEQADVIISDLRGLLPFYGQHLPSIRDARQRHLAPGGVLMPTRDRIFAAMVSNPKGTRWFRDVWLNNPLGLDLTPLVEEAANDVRRDVVTAEQVLTAPVEIGVIDYRSDLTDTGLDYSGSMDVTREGTADGLSVWFEATVIDDITYSTGPFSPPTIYGMAFLPLSRPVALDEGSQVAIEVEARLLGDYVYSWSVSSAGASSWRVGQSTFNVAPLDVAAVGRRKASYRPATNEMMEADRLALTDLGKGQSLGEVAAGLLERFPGRFISFSEALTYVADLTERYAR